MNREEAIRKIRWHLLGLALTDDVREAFNTLIPELVEKGTDEKMLDAILCHVKASNDFTANGVSKEDMVAYLEGKKKKAAIESAYPTSMPEEYGMRKPAERYDIVAKLEEHLANTPKEQLDAEWKALEKWNDVGPTVEEYIYGKIPKFKVGDKIRKIGGNYASWEITGINSILRLYEGKYEEGYPTELSFEEQDSYELATDKPIKTENDTVDIPVSELCENDDERIRNELIDILEKSYEFGGFTLNSKKDLDRYLGYLEKQKEQPTNEEMLRTLRAEYEKGVADTIVKYEQKQEWSEEDRRIMDGIQLVLESWDRTHSSIAGLPSLIPSYISWLKARRPQSKQKRQIKEGDKVSIHCRKDRKEGIITIYDGKVGEVIHVWDAKRNPWGHIGVRLDNGCNNGFYEDELEVLDEPSWKPSEEQMEALRVTIDFMPDTFKPRCTLITLQNGLEKLMSL